LAIAPKPGDEIRSGRVFRRIQPFRTRFKHGRPKVGVFKPTPGDSYNLSTIWEELASQDVVLAAMANNPQLHAFGLCALDVEAIRAESRNYTRFIYDPDPADPVLGHAHVIIPNCDNERVWLLLLRHATTIKPPVGPEIAG